MTSPVLPTISIEQYWNSTLDDLARTICERGKVRVGDIRLRELADTSERPYGVYAFFDSVVQGNCLYVGKVSSRSYAERIPMHFDPRSKSWMNQFTRKLSDRKFNGCYESALLHALDQYIVFLGFRFTSSDAANEHRAKCINRLETALRACLNPSLNGHSRDKINGHMVVSELLAQPV
jgi:hypothetical protein